jgi:hypothetical protein
VSGTNETYFSVRKNSSIKSTSVIGMGKKQREWAGVKIGDMVKGIYKTLGLISSCGLFV